MQVYNEKKVYNVCNVEVIQRAKGQPNEVTNVIFNVKILRV